MSASQAPQESGLQVVQPTPLTISRGPRLGLPTHDELQALMEYGGIIVESGLAPAHIKTPEAAIVMMRYGHQLGIDEFTALQHMYIQNGKPTALASLLHSLILRDHGGDAIRIVESTGEVCRLSCRRRDSEQRTDVTYTIGEAKQAGLLDKPGPWKQYPADMLFARAISRAGRMLYRDSTLGLYVPEELGGSVIEVAGEVVDTSSGEMPRDEKPANPNRLARLHAIGETRGLDHDALHRIAALKLNTSLTKLADTMLRDLETTIETAADEDLILWQLDWTHEINEAANRGMAALDELGKRIKAAGISSKSHPAIAAAYQDAKKRIASEPVEAEFSALPGMPANADRYTG